MSLDIGSNTFINPQNMTNLNMSYSPSGLVTLASKMSASELGDTSFAAEEITNNR